MMDENIIQLIHRQVDGSITAGEKIRLEAYLKQNPEARQAYLEQIETTGLLNEMPSMEIPPNMKKRIMNSIDKKRYTGTERRKGLGSIRSSKIIPRVAFAFSVGLAVGILIHVAFLGDSELTDWSNDRDFIGTIGLHDEAHFKRLEKIPILLTDLRGAIALAQIDYSLAIEVNLNSTNDFELIIKYDSNQIEFQGFKPSTRSRVVLDNGENYIKAMHTNDVQYVLFLKRMSPSTTEIDVTLLFRGDVRLHRTLHLDDINE